VTIIKGIYIFPNIVSDCKYIKVFQFLVYLNARTCIANLPKGLYTCNFLLLKGPSCFKAMVVYKVFIEFLFKLL